MCVWVVQFSLGLHEDGKGNEVDKGSSRGEGVRALTYSKKGTERTGTRQEKVGIDAQRRGSEVKLHSP